MKDGPNAKINALSTLFLDEPKLSIRTPLLLPRGENLVTEAKRDVEVKWMCEIGRELDLGLDTVGAAVSIFDHILTNLSVRFKYANCVATTALYIAIKLLEESLDSIALEDVLADFQVNYSIQEVLRMERIILSQLDWQLQFPSVERFVFLMLAQLDNVIYVESNDLRKRIEDLLCNWNLMSSYRPSVLASSLITVMANEDENGLIGLKVMARMTQKFGIDRNELRQCSSCLEDLFYDASDKEN
uniref:Cyclin-like domain-containing protein n=1 Tax=Panagrolaimus sp. JU765 TaxID=591449 RepID=A0AC34QU30_9BILA